MSNRSVTVDDVVLFLVMTTIVGIMLAISVATDIVSNRVWVSDPVASIAISDSGENDSIDYQTNSSCGEEVIFWALMNGGIVTFESTFVRYDI